ncbi:MAG: ATP-dependent acyl-CoA ligase [Rhizobiales bacterium]|nr:ATP-dependent acyl-CoA ligase [Hyphomicrobiales bacterium]
MALVLRGGREALPLQEFSRRTVPDLLDRSRAFGEDRPFLVDCAAPAPLSYETFLRRVSATAHGLLEHFAPQSRIACMMPNCLEYLVLRYAISVAGMTEVAINTAHKGPVLRAMIELARPHAIIAADGLFETIREAGGGEMLVSEWTRGALLSSEASWSERPSADIDPASPSRLLFTSGTSGRSKAVELSHAYEVYTGERHVDLLSIAKDDRWLYVTPMFHIDAVYIMSILLHTGGSFAWTEKLSASRFWNVAASSQSTYLCYVGAILPILLKHGAPSQPHKLRYCVGGGATARQIAEFENRIGIEVLEAYAMTECIACTFSTSDLKKPGRAGRPVPGYEVAISAEGSEILVRSKEPCGIFSGYFGDAEATSKTMRDGWFHTGDLGSFDEDGFLAFRGRLKDAIRVKGENVSAQELEAIAEGHPDVETAAAIAVSSELAEDEILLYAEPKKGRLLLPESLSDHIRATTARFMWPKYIRIVPSLPRTETQKVRKQELSRDIAPVFGKLRLLRPRG